MSTIQLDLDDDLIALLKAEQGPLEKTARELIVLELYRRHAISRGKAAEFLSMHLADFSELASSVGIPYIEMTDEEWQKELAASRQL